MDRNLYEQIEQYLAGELTGKELQRFNEALQSDPELARTMKEYKEADTDFKLMLEEDETEKTLSLQMKHLGSEYCTEPAAEKGRISRIWIWRAGAVAAAAVLFFFIGRPLFFSRPSVQKLYSTYYQPYELETSTIRGEKGGIDSLLKQADSVYRLKQYNSAIPLYQQYLLTTGNLSTAGLPLATALFESGHSDSASFYFRLVALELPAYRGEAIWFQAMVKLKEKDKEACRVLLKQISRKDDSKYYNRASSLLQKL